MHRAGYWKDRYQAFRLRGLCGSCGKTPQKNRTACFRCARRQAKNHERRKLNELQSNRSNIKK